MTHTVSRTHDTLAHVLDAQGRRVSRHDLISDAYAEAERLNSKETTMPVETMAKTAESAAILVAPLGAHSGTERWAAACAIRSLIEDSADLRRELEAAQSDLKRTKVHANRLAGERDALRDEWREIAAGLTTEEPEVGALWPMVAEVSGSLAAVRLHLKNEVAAHNATKAERDAANAARLAAEGEIADLKLSVIAFAAPHAVCWSAERGFPPGHLHPTHYDILAKAGARMDSFTRAALTTAPEAPKDGE